MTRRAKSKWLIIFLCTIVVGILLTADFLFQESKKVHGHIAIGPDGPMGGDVSYEGSIDVWRTDKKTEVTKFTTDKSGNFTILLSPGTYIFAVPGTNLTYEGSGRHSQQVTVESGSIKKIEISFDTGMR